MKKTRLILASLAILLCGCAVRPPQAMAQFIGYTSPQTVQTSLAITASCTGVAVNYTVPNLGQTQHYATVAFSGAGSITHFQAEIDGIDSAGNPTRISDVLEGSGLMSQVFVLYGTGYFPITRVQVLCTGTALYTLNYSGTSATAAVNLGKYQVTQVDKELAFAASAGTTASYEFQPPFANTDGMLYFVYGTAGPSGSTVTINCAITGGGSTQFSFTPVTTASIYQSLPVGLTPCDDLTVTYTSGGASAATYDMQYIFTNPGQVNPTLSVPTHITGTTATEVKSSSGTLLGINLNTSASGTISLFDLPSASCTGTPSTNTVAVLTIAATEIARSIPFNTWFQNGICVKASAAMDLTVGTQ